MKRLRSTCCLAIACGMLGCFAGEDDSGGSAFQTSGEKYMDADDFPGSCRDTGTDTDPCDTDGTGEPPSMSTGSGQVDPDADQCRTSDECNGGFCAAPFEPAAEANLPGTRGPLACTFTCVPTRDDSLWCGDDAACCDPVATCTPRGYCVLDDG